jgi:hypothetical protein
MKKTLIALIVVTNLVLVSGCSITKYGEFFNASLGTDRVIEEASVTVHTNGVKQYTVKGYKSEQAQVVGAASEGAVRGALMSFGISRNAPPAVVSQPISAPSVTNR